MPDARPYYADSDKGHDDLLRCNDCSRLVTYTALMRKGVTPCCGTRRVKEVRALSGWEWLRVRLGLLQFDHRKEFLAEFARD